MKFKLIIGCVALFIGVSVVLWSLLLVLFKKPAVKPHIKKYIWRMAIGLAGYVLGLFSMNYFYKPQLPYKYWLILLPVLPLIYVCSAIVRFISEGLDEFQRKVVTEAMTFSGLATGFTCFSYLFVADAGGPYFHPEWAFYLMWFYYALGIFFFWRRYK